MQNNPAGRFKKLIGILGNTTPKYLRHLRILNMRQRDESENSPFQIVYQSFEQVEKLVFFFSTQDLLEN